MIITLLSAILVILVVAWILKRRKQERARWTKCPLHYVDGVAYWTNKPEWIEPMGVSVPKPFKLRSE